jgi:hypothetical protein
MHGVSESVLEALARPHLRPPDVAADPGLTVFAYTAEPRSKHEEALRLLGSWAATPVGS